MPNYFEVRHIAQLVKDKLNLDKTETIILFTEKAVLRPDKPLQEMYDKYKDSDGFLYVKYIKEDTFGWKK